MGYRKSVVRKSRSRSRKVKRTKRRRVSRKVKKSKRRQVSRKQVKKTNRKTRPIKKRTYSKSKKIIGGDGIWSGYPGRKETPSWERYVEHFKDFKKGKWGLIIPDTKTVVDVFKFFIKDMNILFELTGYTVKTLEGPTILLAKKEEVKSMKKEVERNKGYGKDVYGLDVELESAKSVIDELINKLKILSGLDIPYLISLLEKTLPYLISLLIENAPNLMGLLNENEELKGLLQNVVEAVKEETVETLMEGVTYLDTLKSGLLQIIPILQTKQNTLKQRIGQLEVKEINTRTEKEQTELNKLWSESYNYSDLFQLQGDLETLKPLLERKNTNDLNELVTILDAVFTIYKNRTDALVYSIEFAGYYSNYRKHGDHRPEIDDYRVRIQVGSNSLLVHYKPLVTFKSIYGSVKEKGILPKTISDTINNLESQFRDWRNTIKEIQRVQVKDTGSEQTWGQYFTSKASDFTSKATDFKSRFVTPQVETKYFNRDTGRLETVTY